MTTTTERLLMTDTQAGTAYIQDWSTNDEGEVVDVTEVEDLPLPDGIDPDDVATAAKRAATAAGFDVRGRKGDNNDLGDAFHVAYGRPV